MRQRLVVMCDWSAIERNAERFCDLQGRQLPQPAEQTVGTPPREEDLVAFAHPHERAREDRQLALLLARRYDGQLRLATVARCHAVLRDRTHEAARICRRADRRAELHQPLVEIAGCRGLGQRSHQLARVRPQRLRARGRLDVLGEAVHARQYARHVAVDERRALAVRDARDRSRGVRPDPGHLAQVRSAPRQRSRELRGDRLRALLEVARARVVAEPGPRGEHVVERRGRERGHRRKLRHPALPVRDHRRDARLLQHDLADPDRVRIARAAPRQIALHLTVVRDDRARDLLRAHAAVIRRPVS